jgi:acetyl/propionyl-CoA carboxylase alpha subunit
VITTQFINKFIRYYPIAIVVHLGERECSIQRRYQKIIKESPSPVVDDDLRRRAWGRAACDLARHAGYANAGTVEFVLDEKVVAFFLYGYLQAHAHARFCCSG